MDRRTLPGAARKSRGDPLRRRCPRHPPRCSADLWGSVPAISATWRNEQPDPAFSGFFRRHGGPPPWGAAWTIKLSRVRLPRGMYRTEVTRGNGIADPELAVDRQVEHREITPAILHLEADSDSPNVFRLQRS